MTGGAKVRWILLNGWAAAVTLLALAQVVLSSSIVDGTFWGPTPFWLAFGPVVVWINLLVASGALFVLMYRESGWRVATAAWSVITSGVGFEIARRAFQSFLQVW